MPNQWYYTKDDERQGPVSADELKRLAEAGELQPDDLIWKDGMEDWRPASQLKGLFDGETAAPTSKPAAVVAGDRSPAWQIPHLIAATLFIVAMFLPWWSLRLSGKPQELEKEFSVEKDIGRGRVRKRPDMAKFRQVWKKTGWYLRHTDTLSVDFGDFPLDGPVRDREIDIQAKIWGLHLGLGLAGGFLGFALIPLAVMIMVWRDARRFSWVASFLAAYISLLLCVMTVIWYFEAPGYDVKPVFSQGAHIGPYLSMGGSALLLIFGMIDGVLGLRAFARRNS